MDGRVAPTSMSGQKSKTKEQFKKLSETFKYYKVYIVIMEVIISDSSSLILIEKITLLDLVKKRFLFYIPEEVYREAILKGKEKNAPDAHTLEDKIKVSIIKVLKVKNISKVEELMKDFGIAKGETEAMVLFLENRAKFLLVDDHKAINACKAHKIPFITTITMVLLLLKQKIINKEKAQQMIKKLAIYGRYKNELIFKALEEVNKNE